METAGDTLRQNYLVAYDVSNPKRLRRVAAALEDFGDRVQLSVFLCELSRRDLAALRERLRDVLDHGEDQVLFATLSAGGTRAGRRRPVETLGRVLATRERRGWVQ